MSVINQLPVITGYTQHGGKDSMAAGKIDRASLIGGFDGANNIEEHFDFTGNVLSRHQGMSAVSKYAQEGISTIQTAEAGMQAAYDDLMAIRDVAMQSAQKADQDVELRDLELSYSILKFNICSKWSQVRFDVQQFFKADGSVLLAMKEASEANNKPVLLALRSFSGRDGSAVASKAPKLDSLELSPADFGSIDTSDSAKEAVSFIDNAISDMSSVRKELGFIRTSFMDIINEFVSRMTNKNEEELQVRSPGEYGSIAKSLLDEIRRRPLSARHAQANLTPRKTLDILA